MNLTQQERRIYILIVERALSNKEIAYDMKLAEGTIKIYLSRLFKKLKVRDRVEMVVKHYKELIQDDVGDRGAD